MRATLQILLMALAAAACSATPDGQLVSSNTDDDLRVLVFSRTAGFRHQSIPDGIAAIQSLGDRYDFDVETTEDPVRFTDETLRDFDAVVFLSTTGDVLDETQERAFERYVRAGGGFVGIHAASDTEYDWPWYGGLVGAYFKRHPQVQEAEITVIDRSHPSTRHLPLRWKRTDEWYDYRRSPRGKVHVLADLDERSYEGGSMAHDHPFAWCHEYDGGRSWYTAGGHTSDSFAEPEFLQHLAGGILWAAGRLDADAGATLDAHYDKVVLDDFVTDPMELAVLPDLRVLFVERPGIVKIWKPDTASTVIAGFVDVYDGLEDGLLGVTIDPNFAANGWVYVYYSPAGDEPKNRLSRLTLEGDSFDPESEVVMLELATQRDECCHAGGSLTFDGAGDLLISTGDNTSPFASGGYSPIDEREGRAPFDAQKSSSNTHDLRGKILRIHPEPDGSYSIPKGNLFPTDGSEGRPEIYVMGCRNPFRISVDRRTGWVYWGDVGPDASVPSDERGPAGHDEFNQARAAGNFGWPYFVGENLPYRDWDFENGEAGSMFAIDAPRNESTNNTGEKILPPAQPAWIAYTYGPTMKYGVLGAGGRCAMAGPMVYLDDVADHPHRLPDYYDRTLFLYEWARNLLLAVKLDESGAPLHVSRFLPSVPFLRPHDMELGPDGRLYLIEWGTGFGGGNEDARIVRIDHYPTGRRPPVASAIASIESGSVPLPVQFDGADSKSRTASPKLGFAWDLDGDGRVDSDTSRPTHRYVKPGNFTARLTVTDANGLEATTTMGITVGNNKPRVAFDWPPDGGMVPLGGLVDFRVTVTDDEDGAVPDDRIQIQPYLGHDTHAHPLHQGRGTSGRLQTLRDEGHGDDADLFTVLAATYTDRGATGVAPLTTRAELVLQPKKKQAEFAKGRSDARIEKTDENASVVFGGEYSWASYSPVHLHGVNALTLRVATGTAGGSLEIRADSAEGRLLGRAEIEAAGRVELEAGTPVPVRVDFFERGGAAGVVLRVEGPDIRKKPIPPTWWGMKTGEGGGVLARYYELDSPNKLPEFDALTPYKDEHVATIDFPSTGDKFAGAGRADDFGVVFTGSLEVPTSGGYAFTLESDDGSRLWVNGQRLIDNDGLHGMVEKSTGHEWKEIMIPVADPGRTHELFVVFSPARGHAEGELRLDWIRFEGPGCEVLVPTASD